MHPPVGRQKSASPKPQVGVFLCISLPHKINGNYLVPNSYRQLPSHQHLHFLPPWYLVEQLPYLHCPRVAFNTFQILFWTFSFAGVSIRPVPPGSAARKPYRPFGQSSSRGGWVFLHLSLLSLFLLSLRMRPSASPHRPTHPPRALSRPVSQPQSKRHLNCTEEFKSATKLIFSGARQNFNFAPCSPFCPGVTGIPELECTQVNNWAASC